MAKRKRAKKKQAAKEPPFNEPSIQFEKTDPINQIIKLTKLSRACATRCEVNTLLAGTWVEQSFVDIARQLGDVFTMLRMNEVISKRG